MKTKRKNELYQQELINDFIILVLEKMKSKIIDINNTSIKLMDQIIRSTGGYDEENIPLYSECYFFLMRNGLYFNDSLENNEYLQQLINTLKDQNSINKQEYNKLKYS